MEPITTEQRNWEESTGVFVHLVDNHGKKIVVAPRVRENFFHNFLVPLIDLIRPVTPLSKDSTRAQG